MEDSKTAIKKTLIYSDIFDYPLTFEQLYTFLLTKKPIEKDLLKKTLESSSFVTKKDNFYVLQGRENLIKLRNERVRWNQQKLQKAKSISRILMHFPTILFIGISGGVAMQNAKKDDDIDLFIITWANTVWISRFYVVFTLLILGVLRRKQMKNVSNKFCVNMIIDETKLAFSKEKQDIYTAHELIQLVPLSQRNNTYKKLLEANTWIKHVMPHAFENIPSVDFSSSDSVFSKILLWIVRVPFVEKIASFMQRNYMRTAAPSETISASFLAFHPDDYREKTLGLYNKRIHEEI